MYTTLKSIHYHHVFTYASFPLGLDINCNDNYVCGDKQSKNTIILSINY